MCPYLKSVLSGIALTTLLLFTGFASAQSMKNYVLTNSNPIRSIDIDDTAYADLQPIAEAIGNRRIVLLGEQDHGDAPTFLAKARLIRFLHQRLGFTVIAFESDLYGLTKGWDAYKAGQLSVMEVLKRNVFPIWTECDACQPLFNYIAETQKSSLPLTVTGFDTQLHGVERRKTYKEDYKQLLQNANVPAFLVSAIDPLLTLVQTNYPLAKNANIAPDSLSRFATLLDSMMKHTEQLPDSSYTRILTASLRAYIYQNKYYNENSYDKMKEVRDVQMAANMEWLIRSKFPNQKIIIWAHNYHIAKNTSTAMAQQQSRYVGMGHLLSQAMGPNMYILGFTSYMGTAGRIYVSPYTVEKPKKNSIEAWFEKKESPFAFLDFTRYRNSNREYFLMKGKAHHNEEAVWNEVFDGVFYIRDMYPCKRLN